MTQRIDYTTIAPDALQALYGLGKPLAKSGLEQSLLVLVQLRASQINRCAFCLALHAREAEALGEGGDRIACLPAWREAAWYSTRERAALEWTEALTVIAAEHPPGNLVARMKEHFSDAELVYLTLAVATINAYNRFNVAFGTPPEGAESVFRMLHGQPAHA